MKKSFFELLTLGEIEIHDHGQDEPCSGWPECYRAYISVNALADRLMRGTINFANAKIRKPNQIHGYFGGAFTPVSIPKLREVRNIQRQLKEWLTADYKGFEPELAPITVMENGGYNGLANKSPSHGHLVGEPIGLQVGPRANTNLRHSNPKLKQVAGHGLSMEFAYRFVNASLHDLVTIGTAFIIQDDLHKKIGLCARDGCDNFFIDKKSRGTPRMYCKTKDCEKILAAKRVADSRANRASNKTRSRK